MPIQDIKSYFPSWYCKFGSLLRILSFVLLIPFAAVVIEILDDRTGFYSPQHPWSLLFKGLTLLIAIPSMILQETIRKLDNLASVMRGLADVNPEARKRSALILRSLGKTYPKHAIPALIDAINDTDNTVATTVVETLKHLTEQKIGRNQSEWEQWKQQSMEKMFASSKNENIITVIVVLVMVAGAAYILLTAKK